MNKIEKIIAAYECGENKTPGERCKTCPYCDNCGDKDEKFYKRFNYGN